MKNIKNLFKNLTAFHYAGFIVALVFIIIFALLSHFHNDFTEQKEQGKIEDTSYDIESDINKLGASVYYSEGNEDALYNYIVNGTEFISDNKDMPYYYYSEINDLLNTELQKAGYTNRELTFTEGKLVGLYYTATFSISDCEDTISVSNNMGKDDYSIIITAN